MRLPFVSRCFCRSIRVRGVWDTPPDNQVTMQVQLLRLLPLQLSPLTSNAQGFGDSAEGKIGMVQHAAWQAHLAFIPMTGTLSASHRPPQLPQQPRPELTQQVCPSLPWCFGIPLWPPVLVYRSLLRVFRCLSRILVGSPCYHQAKSKEKKDREIVPARSLVHCRPHWFEWRFLRTDSCGESGAFSLGHCQSMLCVGST